MERFRHLDELCRDDLPVVGFKAFNLGQLKQAGLPVADGWVLPATVWWDYLKQVTWPADALPNRLAQLDISAAQQLQQISQAWQGAFKATAPPAVAGPPGELAAQGWMLRASLGLRTSPPPPLSQGALPAVMTTATQNFALGIQQFWGQALAASNLLIWQRYCQQLGELELATLVMPIYPALAAGTLELGPKTADIAVVQGLGLTLSRGEAMPALGRIQFPHQDQVQWQAGYQDQHYGWEAKPAGEAIATALTITKRQDSTLTGKTLVTPDQIAMLLALGEQAQQILDSSTIRLEWLLCPGLAGQPAALLLTQADPVPGTPAPPLPTLEKPQLPTVSTVVQGIGASSGRIKGVAIVASRPQDLPDPLPAGSIVVLPDLQPDVFLRLQAVVGIVTEQGGATCHAAILAREMGVPAVVGAPQATQILAHQSPIWLDGDRGIVYGLEAIAPQTARTTPSLTTPTTLALGSTERYADLRTKVMVNLSQTQRLSALAVDSIDGVGLVRSEWLLLDVLEGRHPWHWVNQGQEAELQDRIQQKLEPILQTLGSKPVRYRTLDLRSHEWQALEGSPSAEPNPMLGLRGSLSYNLDPRLFQVELSALAHLQRAGYSNLQLILPFVRTVEEVMACRQLITQTGLTDDPGFALWIMAEVPSVLFLLPAYAQAGVQGIAIGSNDLTQLLLAVDRDQPTLASAYDERHPVVRMAMAHLIESARHCGMVCSICGQAPVRHPELIADLVAWGINSISVEATALSFTLEAVWHAEHTPKG